MPPAAPFAPLGRVSVRPVSKVPAGVWLTFAPMLNAVAIGVPRVSIEAAHSMSWYRWVGSNGVVLSIDRYGASAPFETIYKELGLTVDKIVEAAKSLVRS